MNSRNVTIYVLEHVCQHAEWSVWFRNRILLPFKNVFLLTGTPPMELRWIRNEHVLSCVKCKVVRKHSAVDQDHKHTLLTHRKHLVNQTMQ